MSMIDENIFPTDFRSPIFIGGQRRSGTSLFRVLLNRHRHIACGPEAVFPQDPSFAVWHNLMAHEWGVRLESYGLSTNTLDRAFATLVDTVFARYQLAEGKKRWAEKTPGNIMRIEYLNRLFPTAQFIHLIRDPRDVYCSIRERAERDKPEWVKFTPRRAAVDWCGFVVTGKRWRTHTERYIEVRYEDLVRDPEQVMRRSLQFLGEPWDPSILDPARDTAEARGDQEVRNDRVVRSSSGRWLTELQSDEVRSIQLIAGPLMTELGYELA
jgi:protein-tyrosine sulfotransferase